MSQTPSAAVPMLLIDQYPAFVQHYEVSVAVNTSIEKSKGVCNEADTGFADWQNFVDNSVSSPVPLTASSLGPNEAARLGIIHREHQQLFSGFQRAIRDRFDVFRNADPRIACLNCGPLISCTKSLLSDLLRRQQLELRGARAMDSVRNGVLCSSGDCTVKFAYAEMFGRALELQKRANSFMKNSCL